jgi:hypothetical protein
MATKIPTIKDQYADYPEQTRKFVEQLIAEFPEIVSLPVVNFDTFPGGTVTTNEFQIDKMMLDSEENAEDPLNVMIASYVIGLREHCIKQYGDPAKWSRLAQFKPLGVFTKSEPDDFMVKLGFEWGFKPLIDKPKEEV